MEIALQPVLPPAELEEELAAEISAWFAEAFFGPLEDALPEAPATKRAWVPFPASWGGKGLPRIRLPQVTAADRAALISWLAAVGIRSTLRQMKPAELRPTQDAFKPEKLEEARAHQGTDRPILASADLYVVDGHHQWTAARLDQPDRPIDVVVFDRPLSEILRLAHHFPGATREHAERPNAGADSAPLLAALERGEITYADGAFAGRFSAATSRYLRGIGARWSSDKTAFFIKLQDLPYSLRGTIAMSRGLAEATHKRVQDRLAEIAANVAEAPTAGLAIDLWTERMVTNLAEQFRHSLEVAANTHPALEVVTVPPDFTPGMIADVRQGLTENLDLSIKNFTEDETENLRHLVEQNWMHGGRLEELRAIIRQRWDIAERKARFLASQETSMIASEFARARAQEIGSTEYVWVTRHDAKVRPDHMDLDGKVCFWDSPPLVDRARDRHANPGMDYGCRCQARPLLNFRARRIVA